MYNFNGMLYKILNDGKELTREEEVSINDIIKTAKASFLIASENTMNTYERLDMEGSNKIRMYQDVLNLLGWSEIDFVKVEEEESGIWEI